MAVRPRLAATARLLARLCITVALVSHGAAAWAQGSCDFDYVGAQVLIDDGWIDRTDEDAPRRWAQSLMPSARSVVSDEEYAHFLVVGWQKSPVDLSAMPSGALRRWFEVQATWFARAAKRDGAPVSDGILETAPVTFSVTRTFKHQRGTYANAFYGIAASAKCVLYVILSGPAASEDDVGWQNGLDAVTRIRSAVLDREGPLVRASAPGEATAGAVMPQFDQIAIAAIAFGLFMLLLCVTVELGPAEQLAGYCRYMIGLYCVYAVIAWINGEIGLHIQGVTSANGLAVISVVAGVHAIALFTGSPLVTLAGAALVLAHTSLVLVMLALGSIEASWMVLAWALARVGIVAHLLFTASRLRFAAG